MPTYRFTLPPGRLGIAALFGVLISVFAVVVGLSMLPGILFGTRLTPADAEAGIRGVLLARAATGLHDRLAGATTREHKELVERYTAELAHLKAIRFDSVEVDTSVFSAFRIQRDFVARVVMRDPEHAPSTHYYCFMGRYALGECPAWHWHLAL